MSFASVKKKSRKTSSLLDMSTGQEVDQCQGRVYTSGANAVCPPFTQLSQLSEQKSSEGTKTVPSSQDSNSQKLLFQEVLQQDVKVKKEPGVSKSDVRRPYPKVINVIKETNNKPPFVDLTKEDKEDIDPDKEKKKYQSTTYEERKRRWDQLDKWRITDDVFGDETTKKEGKKDDLTDDEKVSRNNRRVSRKMLSVRDTFLGLADEYKLLYPDLKYVDEDFIRKSLKEIAATVKTFPVRFDTLSCKTIYETLDGVSNDQAEFLYHVGQYTLRTLQARIIADLSRETFTICSELDKYRDVFFAEGGYGEGFLD